jgi:hypothetical protein
MIPKDIRVRRHERVEMNGVFVREVIRWMPRALLGFTIVACAFSGWFFFAASAQATALWHDTVYVCGQLGVPDVITGDNPQMGYHEFSGLPPSLTCRWDSPEGVSMDFVHTDPSADEDYGRGFVALWVAAGLAALFVVAAALPSVRAKISRGHHY